MEWIALLSALEAAVLVNAVHGDLFNYEATVRSEEDGNSFGPSDWHHVSCDDLETCPGWPEKWATGVDWNLTQNHCFNCQENSSECDDDHHQSPINLKRSWGFEQLPEDAHECTDGHWMPYYDGTCTWDMLKAANAFSIERHALRIGQPLEGTTDGESSSYRLNCSTPQGEREFPRIDFPKGFSEMFFLSHTEIKVPSEHTQDGKRYDAEIQLPHFFSASAEDNNGVPNQMGTIAIFLEANDTYAAYPYLDKVICQFRHVEDQVRQDCGMESVTTYYPGCYNHNRTWSSRKLEEGEAQDVVGRHLRTSHNAALDRMLNNGNEKFSLELDPSNFEERRSKEEWSDFVQDYSRQHPLYQQGQVAHHDVDYHDVEHHNYQWLLDVRTEYYFRYGGTMTIPPCYGEFIRSRAQTNNWRVMKDPIRIHPRQLDELHRLLRERTAPPADLNTKARCTTDTAAKIYPDETVSVARPLQELRFSHYNRFCECKDWPSQWPEDQKWCTSGNETYRFFENRYNEVSDKTSCTLGNFLASPNARVQGVGAVLMPTAILSGDTIQSPSVKAFLYQRNDGNLMIMKGDAAAKVSGEVLWESGMSLSIGSYYSELSNQGRLSTRRSADRSIVWSTDILNEHSVYHWFALDCGWKTVGIYEGRWDIPGNVVWKSAALVDFAFGSPPDVFQVPFHASALDYSDFVDSDTFHDGTCSEGPVDAKPINDYVCKSRGSTCTVGWTQSGEELTYAFTSMNSEEILVDVILRVASESTGREFYVEIDNIQEGNSFWTNGGGWDQFDDYVWTTTLSSGLHNLRVKFVSGSMNLCSISVLMKGT